MPYNFLLTVVAVIFLSGCFGNISNRNQTDLANYDFDFSPIAPPSGQTPALVLRQIAVFAPSWLETNQIQYRLAYSETARLEAYASSRWIAPPALLLEHALKQRMASGDLESQAIGCSLRVDLDQFIQIFDTPGSSHALLEVRATLLAPGNEFLLARRSFSKTQAAGADARSGVAAFSLVARDLVNEMNQWLSQSVTATPALVSRCRGA